MSYIGNEPVVYVDLDKLTDVVITTPATDQVLKYNGTNWVNGSAAQPMPAGSVIQVVNATYGTEASSVSSTFADTGLTATITPQFTTSKILVIFSLTDGLKITNNTYLGTRIVRNSTPILTTSNYAMATGNGNVNSGCVSGNYLDSPSTTSATTYKVQFNSVLNAGTVYVQYLSGAFSTITLLEIAG